MKVALRNTARQYGLVGRLLHWTSVALLVTLIFTASEFEDLLPGTERQQLVLQHASYGFLLLGLMLLRLYWRYSSINPVHSYSIARWQKSAAISLHRTIYAVIIGQCLLGISSLVVAGLPLSLFGVVELPALMGANPELARLSNSAHYAISLAIYALFAIHISAAIYHQLFGVLDE